MGAVAIIIISFLIAVIATIVFLVIKGAIIPTKLDVVPKLIKQGKTQKAIKLTKQIIAKDSKNYLAHYYLGKAYLKENKPELAMLEYKIVNENALFGVNINELDFRQEYSALLMQVSVMVFRLVRW